MYEEPEPDESPGEKPLKPSDRAREKSDEFRMHAELAAVFEAHRKFDAHLIPGLDPELVRQVQQQMARLEKSKPADTPLLTPASASDAAEGLNFARTHHLNLNDYHIHRRPGEVMIIRWLQGQAVDVFYERLQAHLDAALNHYREEERSAHEWKQDPDTLAYLKALDEINIKMEDRYLRSIIRQHNAFVLSTQTADELDILHLSDHLMGVSPAEIVGKASAPGDDPTEHERAWFFKLFALRGISSDGVEQMCFFTYLQKAEDTFADDW